MAELTIPGMVAKGKAKLVAKQTSMATNYNQSRERAKGNYGRLPFGPQTKAAYNRGLDTGVYRAPDPEKWATNFAAGAER